LVSELEKTETGDTKPVSLRVLIHHGVATKYLVALYNEIVNEINEHVKMGFRA